MRKIFILLLCLPGLPVSASHIVGGEFELVHLQGNEYRLSLIYYFDVLNNEFFGQPPENVDRNMQVYVYRKSDGRLIMPLSLPFTSKVRVGYTQPDCSKGEVVTDKLIYHRELVLDPGTFNDPGGYYVVWQRCCRNYDISNVVSDDPNKGGTASGQVFYLEFPAVVKNGVPFFNSSPRLFPPLNDYACPNKPYYVDFSGQDDDGDSLVYSLVVPTSTTSSNAIPAPSPGPFPQIIWERGFGLDRIVNGTPVRASNPDLKITPQGFLTVTPRFLGLFTFAVKIEEFRNKEKIGESRRDFQLPVVDCQVAYPPKITGKKLLDGQFYENNISVSFSNDVSDEDRCIVVKVSDPDANKPADSQPDEHFSEEVGIRVVALNFKNPDLSAMLPAESTATLVDGGTTEFRICFPPCPYFEGGPYQIGIIAFDDACALPLLDTLKVQVDVEPPENERVKFVSQDQVTAQLNNGEQGEWFFEAHDAESDILSWFVLTNAFLLDDAGMSVQVTSNENGVLMGSLAWDADCEKFLFNKRTSFEVKILVDDDDICHLNEPDTAIYELNVVLPPNDAPTVDTDLTDNPGEVEVTGIEKKIFENFVFQVTGSDMNATDEITLRMAGDGFRPSDYGMTFSKVSGEGSVTSAFRWDLACDKVNPLTRDQFKMHFIVIDSLNLCQIRRVDSVSVEVRVSPPDNSKPRLTVTNLNPDVFFDNNEVVATLGQPIRLGVTAVDADIAPFQDELQLDLLATGGASTADGYSFTPVRGPSVLSTTFSWDPDCSLFGDGDRESEYEFTFRVGDNRCYSSSADTLKINLKVSDVASELLEWDPPNVFTPNGDGWNEYYSMERADPITGEMVNVLPPDNCEGQFVNIRIYNRWGKLVFESADRGFRWLGLNESAGVYYYFIKYTNKEMKGTVSLRE